MCSCVCVCVCVCDCVCVRSCGRGCVMAGPVERSADWCTLINVGLGIDLCVRGCVCVAVGGDADWCNLSSTSAGVFMCACACVHVVSSGPGEEWRHSAANRFHGLGFRV